MSVFATSHARHISSGPCGVEAMEHAEERESGYYVTISERYLITARSEAEALELVASMSSRMAETRDVLVEAA